MSDSPTPVNLTATYKSSTIVQLEWTFMTPPIDDTKIFVYYQSGGVAYNVSFSLTKDQRSYMMMDLPLEPITNIRMVALMRSNIYMHLPSTTGRPISLSMLNIS